MLGLGTSGAWAQVTAYVVDGTTAPYYTGDNLDPLGDRTTGTPNTVTTRIKAGVSGIVLSSTQIDQAKWNSIYSLVLKPKTTNTEEKVTLTAPAGFIITGYSFKCYARNSKVYYVDKNDTYSDGTKQTVSTNYNAPTSVSVSGIETSSTFFWLCGDNSDWFCFTELKVDLQPVYSISAGGTYYKNYGASNVTSTNSEWARLWVSNTRGPQIAISIGSGSISAFSGYLEAQTSSRTYTIRAVGNYNITGFCIKALAEADDNSDCTVNFTMPDATTPTLSKSDGLKKMTEVTLASPARSTSFSVTSDKANGRLKNVEILVRVTPDDKNITTISNLGVYKIKLVAGDYYIASTSKITTTSSSAGQIQFISTGTANQYYLYSVADKKFFKDSSPDTQKDEAALSLDYSISNATPFNVIPDKIPYQYIIQPSTTTNDNCLIAYAKENNRNVANYRWYSDQYLWETQPVAYDSKSLIENYMTEKSISVILSMLANKVGYPKNSTASYTRLKNLTDSINNTSLADTWRYNADMYTRLQSYYNAYIAETDIVMPEDGKVYRFTNVQKDLTTKFYVYHNLTNNELGLSSSILNNGTDLFVCHVIDASKNQFAFVSTNGYYMVGATGSNGKGMNDTYDSDKQHCTIARHPADNNSTSPSAEKSFGKISMYFKRRVEVTSATYLVVKNDGTWDGNSGSYVNDTYSSMFTIEERSDYYNKVNLTSNGTDAYASLYLPFSVEIPSGITAYKVTSQNGEYAHMEPIVTNGILPKETAAILKKDGQTSNTTVYLSPATGAGEAVAGNLLNGTVAAAEAVPGTGTTYVLGKIGDNIGLYEYTASTLAPGKAYLNVAAGVKALAFDFGDADGIKTMDNGQLKMDNANIFNLAGQRMNKLQRGVNIVNGKKIIVK